MEESLRETESGADTVREICALLEEHRGGEVSALDLRELHSWTDYFIIATVSSGAHRDGLVRRVKEFAREKGIQIIGRTGKSGDGWSLVDLGTAVIHLMSPDFRSFYELEQLWSSAGIVYSSKSSS